MKKPVNIHGIRIRTVNIVMLTLSLVLFIVVLYTTIRLSHEYSASVEAMESYLSMETSTHSIHVASDYLTEQARLYTQTGKREHADNFFNEFSTRQTREHALNALASEGRLPQDDQALQQALNLSNGLAQIEIYAMRLMAEAMQEDLLSFPQAIRSVHLTANDRLATADEKREKARLLMFNERYQHMKTDILTLLSDFLSRYVAITRNNLEKRTEALGIVVDEQRIVLVALCLLNILTFAMIIVLIVKPLQVYLKCIRNDKMIEVMGAYEFQHLALTYNDIFAVKEHHDKMLKYRAEHDPLTGLLNRSAYDSLTRLLAQEDQPVGLLLIDVDKFKSVNDTYGHATGDRTLKKVGLLLQHGFRADDFCVRIGGDEFAVIMHDIGNNIIERVKGKIAYFNSVLQNPDDDVPKTSLSVGGAVSTHGFTTSLFNEADAALYHVKETGRCGCIFFEELDLPALKQESGHAAPGDSGK